ncbi:hypothetical protein RB653_002808 [Dictyostelium firmibasis]|uniref:RRM domain-containing protein n=1 Tax=Dictyostelium firmibasis TaxID=79012 RepID=A0AAN7U3J0_9MYCE
MSSKVYVGNLSWSTTEDSLQNAFSQYGEIDMVQLIRDRDTGRSRGFGFVTYKDPSSANKAIDGLHEQDLDGRRIKVNLENKRW